MKPRTASNGMAGDLADARRFRRASTHYQSARVSYLRYAPVSERGPQGQEGRRPTLVQRAGTFASGAVVCVLVGSLVGAGVGSRLSWAASPLGEDAVLTLDRRKKVATHADTNGAPAFSPTAALLAVSVPNGVLLADAEGRVPNRLLDLPGGAQSMAFTPDGKELWVAQANKDGGELHVLNVAKARWQESFPLHGRMPINLSFTVDGEVLGAIRKGNEIRVWAFSMTADGPKARWALVWPSRRGRFAMSPWGSYLAVQMPAGMSTVSGPGVMQVFDIAKCVELLCGSAPWESSPVTAFSADDRLVLAGGDWGGAVIWDVGMKGVVMGLPFPRAGITAACFSRDGRVIALSGAGGEIRVSLLASGVFAIFDTLKEERSSLALSSDGRYLAIGRKGSTDVYDLGTRLAEARRRAGVPTEKELAKSLEGLGGSRPADVFRDICVLVRGAERSLPFMQARLSPKALLRERLTRLVGKAAPEDQATGNEAVEALMAHGKRALPVLRSLARDSDIPEQRKHLASIIAQIVAAPLTAEELRYLRGLRVLESLWTLPASQQLVKRWEAAKLGPAFDAELARIRRRRNWSSIRREVVGASEDSPGK